MDCNYKELKRKANKDLEGRQETTTVQRTAGVTRYLKGEVNKDIKVRSNMLYLFSPENLALKRKRGDREQGQMEQIKNVDNDLKSAQHGTHLAQFCPFALLKSSPCFDGC